MTALELLSGAVALVKEVMMLNQLHNSRPFRDNDDEDFYKLKLPKEDVMMVDTKELFEEFLRRVAGVNVVGVDMEYTPSIWFQRKIDIVQVGFKKERGMALKLRPSVQIATSAEVFLIDLNTLSSEVGSQDFARFAEAVFENGDMVKVKRSPTNLSLIAISPRLVVDWTTI